MKFTLDNILFVIFVQFCFKFPHPAESRKPISKTCIPNPKQGASQYIVAYGSLMSTPSKNRTYPNTMENIPVTVKGFARSWNCKGVSSTLSTTYLGAIWDPRSSFNGVIFRLTNSTGPDSEKALRDFDKRESFYCRKEVQFKDLDFLGMNFSSSGNAQFWIYVTNPKYTARPSDMYPIVQSYVDIWISGCLEIQEKFELSGFAKECVTSTSGWSRHWINDRIFPRRPFIYQPNARAIDTLLAETIPTEFSAIRNNVENNVPRISVIIFLLMSLQFNYNILSTC